MRLSIVFELLLIFLLIAFSAYARVIDQHAAVHRISRAVSNTTKQSPVTITMPSLKQAEETMNKHCYCNEDVCNCCREFHIPLVHLNGPGCASLKYLQGDNLQVQLSFGNNILTTGVISGKNPKPICVTLPGGYSKFCGKIYSIKKESDRHFKACLGLELQSSNELEASLRVSCFRFGPDGLKLQPAEEFPLVITPDPVDEDDDDDLFGLGDDDDDDEDDEDDDEDDGIVPSGNVASDAAGEEDEDEEEDEEDDDVLGFEALLDIFTGDDETTKRPKVTTPLPIIPPFTLPTLTSPSSNVPVGNDVEVEETLVPQASSLTKPEESVTVKVDAEPSTAEDNTEKSNIEDEAIATEITLNEENEGKKPESAEQMEHETVKPEKVTNNKIKKGSSKPSVTSTSLNAITSDVKKPLVRPSTPDPAINDVVPLEEQVQEDDDEDDILGTEDLDEEDEDDEDEKEESEEEEEDEDEEEDQEAADSDEADDIKDEELEEELEDEDEEEEEEALSALVEDEKKPNTKSKKVPTKTKLPNKLNEASNPEEDDADYGYSLAEFLARKVPRVSGRQSKVMRL